LVNFEDGQNEADKLGKTAQNDDKLVASLVTQSNLLSGGMEDHFVGHIFGDSDEIDRIRALEHCSNINILPEKFIPSTTPSKPLKDESEINTTEPLMKKQESDVPPELENAVD
jgi:hypothetical protein